MTTHATHLLSTIMPAAILVAAGLSSCSGNDTPPQGAAIRFTAAAPYSPAARAAITTSTLTDFKVWAYSQGEKYINGIDVVRSASGWQYSPLYFWPLGRKLNFYSVAPSDLDRYTQGDNPQYDVTEFRSPGDVDFLYAVNMGLTSATAQVQVNFRHALSQVNFLFRRAPGEDTRITVSDVELMFVYDSGSFRFPRATTSSDGRETSTGLWDVSVSDHRTNIAINREAHTLADSPVQLNSSGAQFFIPQTLPPCTDASAPVASDRHSGSYLRVKCRIDSSDGDPVWPDSSELDSATGMAWLIIPLSNDYSIWEPGYCYNYTVSIATPLSPDVISFDITVDDYDYFK